MIGHWLRFGEGPMPQDGEAIVYIRFGTAVQQLVEGVAGYVTPAIHRAGTLFSQEGSAEPVPFGSLWTSLPPPSR